MKNKMANLILEIYKKTIAYELDSISINEDGTTTHRHSDKFLDEHPERKESPEFTEEEEKEQIEFIGNVAKKTAKEWGDILKKNFNK